MKFEDLIAKCPKCGSTDKTAHRRFIDNQNSNVTIADMFLKQVMIRKNQKRKPLKRTSSVN